MTTNSKSNEEFFGNDGLDLDQKLVDYGMIALTLFMGSCVSIIIALRIWNWLH